MDRENSTRLPHMQVDYIDGICSPLYKVKPAHILLDVCVSMCAVFPKCTFVAVLSLFTQQILWHVHFVFLFRFFDAQALAGIFQSCSPLIEGCRRNRKHWQQLAESREEGRKKRNKNEQYEKKEIACWEVEHSKSEISHVWYSDLSAHMM